MINGSSAVLIGGGIVSAILFYVSFQIREQRRKNEEQDIEVPQTNQYLELWLLFLGFFSLILVAKSALDLQTICEIVPINQTVVGNITTTSYSSFCYTNPNNTNEQFYTTVLTGLAAAIVYFLLIIIKKIFAWAKSKLLGRGRG